MPERPRDQQAIAWWVEAALGSDPILIAVRSGLSAEVISTSIQEVDRLAASSGGAREECRVKLRSARGTIDLAQRAVLVGDKEAEYFLDLCLRVAEDLQQSFAGLWEELLWFQNGQALVGQILILAHGPMLGLFPGKEAEIEALHNAYDCRTDGGVGAWTRTLP